MTVQDLDMKLDDAAFDGDIAACCAILAQIREIEGPAFNAGAHLNAVSAKTEFAVKVIQAFR
ncbi:hypothetical protein A2415_02115 [candidate division WWE3 bacterium RIFOXYC1_FULL_39_7]|uniref:Uncharacterized protein n=2 Tax=Katanobacteria TaxID=422282 RepID=A0A1F4X8Z3_UNCKA|nr:MAG: hypothetical protein A2415_02115 [candidate division WWE3 bacterium RIFOXYC1_FULL_39_7]OGC78157.1 MAG: hypothetical protein A2619_01700 [candidate division WWE3 bacterium RIFOXYD1_FULL_39_9]